MGRHLRVVVLHMGPEVVLGEFRLRDPELDFEIMSRARCEIRSTMLYLPGTMDRLSTVVEYVFRSTEQCGDWLRNCEAVIRKHNLAYVEKADWRLMA
jgi:hypothetical protein